MDRSGRRRRVPELIVGVLAPAVPRVARHRAEEEEEEDAGSGEINELAPAAELDEDCDQQGREAVEQGGPVCRIDVRMGEMV